MDKTTSFQTYDDRSDAATVAPRLAALRAELAARGLGTTSPNPVVGSVILDAGGAVVGEGWHEFAGGPHAEVRYQSDV